MMMLTTRLLLPKEKVLVYMISVVLLQRKILPEMQEKLLLQREIFFGMSGLTKVTLKDPHDDA